LKLSRLIQRWRGLVWWKQGGLALVGILSAAGSGVVIAILYSRSLSDSNDYIGAWFEHPDRRPSLTTERNEPCPGAPFLLPSSGLIGLLWNDPALPYNMLRRHSGIDIFGDGAPGRVPVVAAYPGYLTRLPDWKSTVIIRHDDPLQLGRIIWTYYTHMAARDGETSYVAETFAPGTSSVWVEQGTLIGYQGEYAGNSLAPIGLHLHFSIVKSEPDGSFKNEAQINNTLDPSPYLGINVNIKGKPPRPILCR
jgi:murein DD-endopeptidase MepM/ murein hydrolase activator NlpD